MTNISVQLGRHRLRIATDSRKAVRLLRRSLRDHLINDQADVELGFVLHRPSRRKRSYRLIDRTGFELCTSEGVDAGLASLSTHLAALLPLRAGTVRLQAQLVTAPDRAVLCLFPVLYMPSVTETELIARGLETVDQLTVDIDVETGWARRTPIPWSQLETVTLGPGHGRLSHDRPITAVAVLSPAGGMQPSRATVAAMLAATALDGSPHDILNACVALVSSAEIVRSLPGDTAADDRT